MKQNPVRTLFRKPTRALLVTFLIVTGTQLAAAQSFTENRLERGTELLRAGSFDEAIVEFNLAAIGLLDRPNAYVHCKTLLFLAQSGAGQRAAAKATLLLIARVEERMQAYSRATLSSQDRAVFEAAALGELEDESLSQTPRFAAIMQRAAERAQPKPSVTEQSTSDLKVQSEANPNDPRSQEALALRLYSQAKVVDAQRAADRLTALEPDNPIGRCIEATTSAARNRSLCERYLPQMATCADALQTAFHIETRLTCHVDTRSYNAGRDYLAQLEPDRVAAARVNGLVRRITRRADPVETVAQTAPETTPTPAIAEATPSADSPAEQGTGSRSAADQQTESRATLLREVENLRARAAAAYGAQDRGEMELVIAQMRSLADQHRGSTEAQQAAGDTAFLLADWSTVITYLERARPFDSAQANSTYYLAVALWERGQPAQARERLQQALQFGLSRTPHVRSYEDKILQSTP